MKTNTNQRSRSKRDLTLIMLTPRRLVSDGEAYVGLVITPDNLHATLEMMDERNMGLHPKTLSCALKEIRLYGRADLI